MHGTGWLADLVVVFAVAVAVALLFARLRLPAVTGFLVAGVLVGPGGLALVESTERISTLAEIGVVMLLFTVGLELSLDHLRRLWRPVAVGGTLQVVLTGLAGFAVARGLGFAEPSAVLAAFLVAMSSTAIVLRALAARGETEAPHGRLVVGVLIFQDLCVVPMMLALPMLAGAGGGLAAALGVAGKAIAVVAGTLVLGRFAVPWLLRRVAALGSREVLLLTVVLVSAGTLWATAQTGLSMALGAFLAGVVVAGTPFGRQAISDALPLRDIFLSLFFVSVGMLLDVATVAERPLLVLALALALFAGKALLAGAAALVLRMPVRAAVLAGVALAQVGEFSFVLLTAGTGLGLIDAESARVFLAAAVVTMLVTPPVIALSPRLAAGAARMGALGRLLGVRAVDESPEAHRGLADHVIVAGFGTGGRMIADALRELDLPYMIVDLNAESVRRAEADGLPAYYGDVTSAEVLRLSGLERAAAFVLVLSDPGATQRAVEVARGVAPRVPILARCRFAGEVEDLRRRGATLVVPAEVESSVEVLAGLLRLRGVPRNVIDARVEAARAAAGPLERRLTIPPTARPDLGDLLRQVRLESYLVGAADWAAGKSILESQVRPATGASVVALRRAGKLQGNPPADERFAAGDIVYLIGTREEVARAADWLARGPGGTAPAGSPAPDAVPT
ncbi:MAG: sodium:proton exchanger [Myxococcales bacterium]|nr:sodium:proton exchanger [Myxococcales bacterium]